MSNLARWAKRPIEEANLFNPAFICSLTYDFIKEFSKTHPNGPSLMLVILALTGSLHRQTRLRLPYSTVTSMYEWIQDNEDLLVGFGERAKNVSPYIKEAIMFGMALNCICSSKSNYLQIASVKASFPKSFIENTTPETKDIIDRGKFMARWCAKSGSELSILAAWGIKP